MSAPIERFQGFLICRNYVDDSFWWRDDAFAVLSTTTFPSVKACREDIAASGRRPSVSVDRDMRIKVTLSNAGGPLDTIYASSPGKAVEELIAMLETLNELYPGDTITVEEGV